MLKDAAFALRYHSRHKLITIVATAMMAVGIGATTAMFTVMNSVLWRALPYEAPGRLVTIWETFPHWRGRPVLDTRWDRIGLSYREYRAVTALDSSFESVAAAYWRAGVRLRDGNETVEIPVARGSASLLPLLGRLPTLGRWFLPGEEGSGAPPLAVLSHTIWTTRFGADPSVVGRSIVLDDEPFVIVGVLPADLRLDSLSPFASPEDRDAVWTPIGSWPGDLTENSQNYEILARLRPGVALDATRQRVAVAIRGSRSAAQHDARVLPRLDAETNGVRRPLFALLGAVGVLLVVACSNLAALLLGEAAGRESEVRVRLALGARPSRIIRQLLVETGMLSIAGAATGIPVALALTRALVSVAPFDLPRGGGIAPDWRAFALSSVLAIGAAVVCGLAPALSLLRPSAHAQTGQRTTTGHRRFIQDALIGAQIALSVVLVISAGLFVRTFALERRVRVGFDRDRLLTVSIDHAPQMFFDRLVERVQALPGVTSVTTTSSLPIAGRGGQWSVSPAPDMKLTLSSPSAQHNEVAPNYFKALRIPILAGRALDDRDVRGATIAAVVNETMARQLWPRETALGRQFLAPNGGVRTVVGIAADVRERGLGRLPSETFYESVRQIPVAPSSQVLLIRTAGNTRALAPSVRRAMSAIDPNVPIGAIETMDEIVERSLSPERFRVLLAGFFAAAALGMTLVGVFGVALRAVTAQMRELCVRLAIGASPAGVMALVVSRYVRVGLAGLIAGASIAMWTTRLLRAYLFGVRAGDPVTFAVSAAFLLGLVAIAAWLPARGVGRGQIIEHLRG